MLRKEMVVASLAAAIFLCGCSASQSGSKDPAQELTAQIGLPVHAKQLGSHQRQTSAGDWISVTRFEATLESSDLDSSEGNTIIRVPNGFEKTGGPSDVQAGCEFGPSACVGAEIADYLGPGPKGCGVKLIEVVAPPVGDSGARVFEVTVFCPA